jgi:hypothetical protein
MRSGDSGAMRLEAGALLAAWEAGATAPVLDRAPSLLTSLELIADDEQLDALTVGRCDSELLALRRELFGETLEGVSQCPRCASEIELDLPLAELQPVASADRAVHVRVCEGGYEIDCEPLYNRDLRAIAGLGEAPELTDIVTRCVIEARDVGGHVVAPHELPRAVAEAVVREVAASDPGAQVTLAVICPCGHEWLAELDIRTILWTELTDWVGRTLPEVHALAQVYGWSEREILAMSGWRRRWYLEASGW